MSLKYILQNQTSWPSEQNQQWLWCREGILPRWKQVNAQSWSHQWLLIRWEWNIQVEEWHRNIGIFVNSILVTKNDQSCSLVSSMIGHFSALLMCLYQYGYCGCQVLPCRSSKSFESQPKFHCLADISFTYCRFPLVHFLVEILKEVLHLQALQ